LPSDGGTRLHPFNIALPNPLFPIGDQPILEIIIRQLIPCGFSQIALAVVAIGIGTHTPLLWLLRAAALIAIGRIAGTVALAAISLSYALPAARLLSPWSSPRIAGALGDPNRYRHAVHRYAACGNGQRLHGPAHGGRERRGLALPVDLRLRPAA